MVAVDSVSGTSETEVAGKPRGQKSYGKLPLSFEANEGQIDGRVRFVSRGTGYNLFLTPTEAVLRLRIAERRVGSERQEDFATRSLSTSRREKSAVLHLKFVDANTSPQVTGEDELPGKSNYLIGNDATKWRTNVSNYARVKYEGLYSGVDLVYYGNQQRLEYDFVVAPGVDPSVIKLAFDGARNMRVDAWGELVLQTAGGDVCWHKPLIYQEIDGIRREVSGSYVVKARREVGFRVGGYDASRPLIIDPVLVYSTYLGGSDNDLAQDIVVDGAGNAYITGQTLSTNFPITAGAAQTTSSGNYDAFVTKLNPTGSAQLYSTYLGGSNSLEGPGLDIGLGIAVDGAGNAYVTGQTQSTSFPTTAGAVQTTNTGGVRAFVTKLDPNGSALVYSTYLGGNSTDVGQSIAIDAAGNAYVGGSTSSTNFPVTLGAVQAINAGSTDAFVSKVNATGSSLLYSTYLGGNSSEESLGLALDGTGSAYVTGYTQSANFPTTPGAVQTTSGGSLDAFVTKLNASGSIRLYSTYLGGGNVDVGHDITVDLTGNAYVTGQTQSTDFPTTAGVVQATSAGSVDAFVTKLDATGSSWLYSTYLGGSNADMSLGIALDGIGSAYVTGQTLSTNFPATAGAVQTTNAGANDAFVTAMDATGSTWVYSTYLGGSSDEIGSAIAVDGTGIFYVAGQTHSTNFLTTAGAKQTANAGGNDAFVTKVGYPAEGLTRYDERTTFTNAANALCPTAATEIIDFTRNDNGTLITDPAADRFFSTLTLSGTTFRNVYSYYNESVYNFPTALIQADLPPNTFAFAANLTPFYQTAGTYTITLSSGEVYYVATDGVRTSGTDLDFFGVISNTPIEWVKFSYDNDYLVIDNFTIGTGCNTTCVPAPSGVVGWWPGDGNANDLQGSNNGALQNGAAFVPGMVGQAFSFNGTNAYVRVPDNATLYPDAGAFTVGAWIKTTQQGPGNEIILAHYECANSCPTSQANSIYAMAVDDNGKLLGSIRDSAGNQQNLTSAEVVADGLYHHVSMVRDNTNHQFLLYVDGVVDASATLTVMGTIKDDDGEADPLTIGAVIQGGTNQAVQFFNGQIDEVMYSNRAVTATEVQATVNAGSAGNCKDGPTPTPTPTPAPQADLSITKTSSLAGSVTTSSQITYTITVNNSGPDQATAVNVEDAIPGGTTYSSFSTSQASCTPPSPNTTSPALSCALGTVNAGSSATITLTVNVFALPGATISNTTSVSSSTTDPDANNNSATTSNQVSGCDLVVSNTNDTGAQSLRLAIQCANANPGLDTIAFNIPGPGVHTIQPQSALPTIIDPLVIDGPTQPGFNGAPVIELSGALAGAVNGLDIAAGNSSVRGLVINRFDGRGIVLFANGNNRIEGNYIGTNAAGTAAMANSGTGIIVDNSANNTIGGNSAARRNLISGNIGLGIDIFGGGAGSSNNHVSGNYVGTDVTGMAAIPNGGPGTLGAIAIGDAFKNVIGGTMPGEGNVVSGNSGAGVIIRGAAASGNQVQGNFIGLNALGTASLGNQAQGVFIFEASNNIIGGTQPGARNVISSNVFSNVGITGAGSINNKVFGNYIGTNAAGTAAVTNPGAGVTISTNAVGNGIGGSGAGNVISGNLGAGISIFGNANFNSAQGNLLGTDATGTLAVGNVGNGVEINDSNGNLIGGATAAARNVISGNINVPANGTGHGIVLGGSNASGNFIQGNYIGTDITGTLKLANGRGGVFVFNGASSNTIGGASITPGFSLGNLISGNALDGISIQGVFGSAIAARNNVVSGNLIGTDVSGALALGNGSAGIRVTGNENSIGGTTTASRNVISGNLAGGVVIANGATRNSVQRNFIGTKANGTQTLPNSGSGVTLTNGVSLNTIGGPTTGEANVVSGNSVSGVVVQSNGSTGNSVMFNFIGTDTTGTVDLGNGLHGVIIGTGGASGNTVGGNTIKFNHAVGVAIPSGTGNVISQNSIFSNGLPGIAINPNGVTLNDACDTDTGPNNRQNFPVLSSISTFGGTPTIQGTLNSAPNSTFTIEFFSNDACDPSGFGEGQTYIGLTTVTTDQNCQASFTFASLTPLSGQFITATATDANGNTSEFSACGFVNADLSISQTAPPNPVVTGSEMTWTLAVNYSGPAPAANTTVTDNLPPQAMFKAIEAPLGWVCTTPAIGSNGIVSCTKTTMASIESPATFTIVATTDCAIANGNSIGNAATVSTSSTDANPANNSSTATVTASDPPPNITAPSGVTAYTGPASTSCSTIVSDAALGVAKASDNCGNPALVRSGVPVGNVFPIGLTTVTYTATDGNGNHASATQTITVIDNTVPVINQSTNITMTANVGSNSAPVSYPAPNASDTCSVPVVTCSLASGSSFAVGTTTVSCTATDGSGNTASSAFTVTVLTPQGATQQLIGAVNVLVSQGTLSQANGNALTSKLQSAINSLNRGNTNSACNQLQLFIDQVQAFINSRKLTQPQGQVLIESANALRRILGC